VTDDFIARYGGRIFNTAGDAVLAEFPSAVEAVRCAIDIQESLRTRNMAYPASRQMSFRIGITIGDVVERDGDLLGDGVNIAARLEGLAEVGGICISRAVHEQVANKLSVQFADIGAQEVKNIPNPVHAYLVAMRREDGTYATPQIKKPLRLPCHRNRSLCSRTELRLADCFLSRLRKDEQEAASSGERRKTPRHRPIHIAPEWHHEIGDAVESLPSPLVELRRLAVARRQRIDFRVGARETQREPLLALAAEFCEPV
jgi:hypothetical protein